MASQKALLKIICWHFWWLYHGCCATYLTNQSWPDRMKDCNKIQGGKRINSKVIRSGCYSFTVHSHPDSSTISGKDLSCLNKIISQMSGLERPVAEAGLRCEWEPGAAPSARPMAWVHNKEGCFCLDGGKVNPQLSQHDTSARIITELERVCLIFKKQNVYATCNCNAVNILWQGLTYEGHFTGSCSYKAFLSHSELHFYFFFHFKSNWIFKCTFVF